MAEDKTYTLEELKEKLIGKTMEYANLETTCNQNGSNLRYDIKLLRESIVLIEGKSEWSCSDIEMKGDVLFKSPFVKVRYLGKDENGEHYKVVE